MGHTTSVEKRENVRHVQKCMATRLRKFKSKLVKKELSRGKFVGGRGRLANAATNEIQVYYGLAVSRNAAKRLEEMLFVKHFFNWLPRTKTSLMECAQKVITVGVSFRRQFLTMTHMTMNNIPIFHRLP